MNDAMINMILDDKPYFMRWVSRFVDDAECEDMLQELFCKLCARIYFIENPKTWATTALRNICFNYMKNYYMTAQYDEEIAKGHPLMIQDDSALDAYYAKQMINHLEAELEMMGANEKDAFGLKAYSNLRYNEIAKVIDIPEGTVKSRINRTRISLKESMP